MKNSSNWSKISKKSTEKAIFETFPIESIERGKPWVCHQRRRHQTPRRPLLRETTTDFVVCTFHYFPEFPIRSHAEAFYQLRKTLGKHEQHNSFDITQHEYRCRKFVLGIDMEKGIRSG